MGAVVQAKAEVPAKEVNYLPHLLRHESQARAEEVVGRDGQADEEVEQPED